LIESLIKNNLISNKDQIKIIGDNMLNYALTFSVWKMRDKSEMIQNLMISYYHREDHINKIKSGELSVTQKENQKSKMIRKKQKKFCKLKMT
jgi:superfamily I DNA and/or RNA helicase